MAGYSIPVIASACGGAILARHFGAEGRGVVAAVLLIPNLVWGVCQLGMGQAVPYFVATRQLPGRGVVGSATLLAVVACLVVSGLALNWQVSLLRDYRPGVALAGLVFLSYPTAMALIAVPWGAFHGSGLFREWNILRLVPQITYITAILAIIAWRVEGAESVAYVYLCLLVLVSLPLTWWRFHKVFSGWPSIQLSLIPKLLYFGLAVLGGALPQLLVQRVDQLFVASQMSIADLGHYVVGIAFASLSMPATQVITAHALPRIARSANPQRVFLPVLALALAALVAQTLVLIGLLPYVVPLVFGREFAASLSMYRVLAVYGAVAALGQVATDCARASGAPGLGAIGPWCGLASCSLGLWLLSSDSSAGLMGLSLVMLAGAGVSAFVTVVVMLRKPLLRSPAI